MSRFVALTVVLLSVRGLQALAHNPHFCASSKRLILRSSKTALGPAQKDVFGSPVRQLTSQTCTTASKRTRGWSSGFIEQRPRQIQRGRFWRVQGCR